MFASGGREVNPFTIDRRFILSPLRRVSSYRSFAHTRRNVIGCFTMSPPSLDKLRILQYPSPILSRAAEPVEEFDDALRALASRMLALMREAKGVGLAAPQVGMGIRLFVCNPTGEEGDDIVCVNPTLTELTGAAEEEEGCLSIPGVTVNIRRATSAVLKRHNLEGHAITQRATDLVARIWQHEADHLDGRLILDQMSTADEIVNRRAIKQLKEQYQAEK